MAEWLDEFPSTYHCGLINVGGEAIALNVLTAAVLYKSTKPYYTALHGQYPPLEPVIQRPGVLRHDCQIKQVHSHRDYRVENRGNRQRGIFKAGPGSVFQPQEVHATLLDVRSPPPSLTVPVILLSLCDLEKKSRLGSVVSPAPEDMACRHIHGTMSPPCVLFFFIMTFDSYLPSLFLLSI
jgi:hypothetical protein